MPLTGNNMLADMVVKMMAHFTQPLITEGHHHFRAGKLTTAV